MPQQLAVLAQALPMILTALETIFNTLNAPQNQALWADIQKRLTSLEQQIAAHNAQSTAPSQGT